MDVFLVTPSTPLRWRWTYPAIGRRRRLDPEVVELVLRWARDNPRWGYPRIVGECRKLGVYVHRRLDAVFAAGVEVVRIPPRAPKANAFAERVGSHGAVRVPGLGADLVPTSPGAGAGRLREA